MSFEVFAVWTCGMCGAKERVEAPAELTVNHYRIPAPDGWARGYWGTACSSCDAKLAALSKKQNAEREALIESIRADSGKE